MNTFNEILTSALSLDERERALIAEKIISSLDSQIDLQSEKYWQTEIENRVKEIDNGYVNLIGWEEAKKRLK
jgi:putative addiction module component (TIGR02574 family)